MSSPASRLGAESLLQISAGTIGHYQAHADSFWEGTRDHDVQQNVQTLLDGLTGAGPHRILDLGCGPGRDVRTFSELGHQVTGLDGCARFCEMARAWSGCPVLHQDMLALQLPAGGFDGVFANASLFHVPSQELPRVLDELWTALVPDGVLFASNPRGPNAEGWQGDRYGAYHSAERWSAYLTQAGFSEICSYYRPPGRPRAQQPWLATSWRRLAVRPDACA